MYYNLLLITALALILISCGGASKSVTGEQEDAGAQLTVIEDFRERAVMPDESDDYVVIPRDTVFSGQFDELFHNSDRQKIWGSTWNQRAAESEIVHDEFDGRSTLRVKYPAGDIGPADSGVQFPIVFANVDGVEEAYYEELYLRYYFKFEEGFDFKLGGKLPGLMGGGNSWKRSGGVQPDGANGWTLRFMWLRNGRIAVYAYVPRSGNGTWGGRTWGQNIDCNFVAEPGRWHYIDQYVHVGTPGKDDGRLIVWIDGVRKLDIDDIRFWDVENNFGRIGGIYFSSFHGGNTDDWAPLHDSYIRFADVIAYKVREYRRIEDE